MNEILAFGNHIVLELTQEKFIEFQNFLDEYHAPAKERALLKDMPNTPHTMEMVGLIRKYCVREMLGQDEKFQVSLRLKGRGKNRPKRRCMWSGKLETKATLNHNESERFSLYAHKDWRF